MLAWTSRRRSTSWVGTVMAARPLSGRSRVAPLDRWSKSGADLSPRCRMRGRRRGGDHAAMDRLSALDASFLRVETATAHMHVGWLAMLDLPAGAEALEVDDVLARIEGRLHHVPRFRQVLREPPG